ncbi:SusC/RagA family TonB-linked outer membrane protein [Desertivirga xinjiangensis]|uniref:SusC/RagA family TonB-linked outer membrane protein n=1 Tax=Desertivirga xinjiangensis TaxID=539206 RepID=UPI002109DA50|nr:TonB-dependent receptor [Pedobacter xinjiangensis]
MCSFLFRKINVLLVIITVITTTQTSAKVPGTVSATYLKEVPAQNLKVTGKVTDQKGEPLIGVTVKVKGVNTGTTTDVQGNYSITVKDRSVVLVFSYLGFATREVPVTQNVLNVKLTEQKTGLDEVVVIGYGTQTRKDVTGAVSQVNVKDMQKAPVKSFDEALAGRVAGVQVSGNDGQPGSLNNIIIRGGNSVTQDNTPLYVVDGFPLENPDYNMISPADIESIDVLKDASATAIYGARGANGVIIITTKKGVEGIPEVSYSGYYGAQKISKTMDLMSPYEFVKYFHELNPQVAEIAYLSNGKTLESYRDVEGVDFQDHAFRTAPIQNHDIALRGGTKTTKYSVSGNIFRQDGIFVNSGFERNQGRLTLDQTVSKKLKVFTTINLSNSSSFGSLIGAAEERGSTASALYGVWAYRPVPINDENLLSDLINPDSEGTTYSDYRVNPILNAKNELRRQTNNSLNLNGYADYDLSPDIKIRIRGGVNIGSRKEENFFNRFTSSGYWSVPNGSIYNNQTTNWLNENTITYKKTFEKIHRLEVLGGFTLQGDKFSRNGFSARDLVTESLGIDGLDNSRSIVPYSATSRWGLVSYLGRANYSYKSKYLFTASLRADGSSKFIGDNRWGYFPSGSVAWRMSSENFMKKFDFITDAKLRLSYGATGNNRIADFPYLSLFETNNSYYSFNNLEPLPGLDVSQFGNTDLRWETTYQTNLGYDLNLFRGRVEFTAEVYQKKTKDLLLNADVPFTTGLASVFRNVGSIKNEGLELSLNTANIKKENFSWSTSFNISFNRNKVIELAENQQTLTKTTLLRPGYNNLYPYIAIVGQPVAQFYGLIWDGVYQYKDFDLLPNGTYSLKDNITDNGEARGAVKPGDIKYRDINGDRKVNASDYTAIGRALPIHTCGFNNNLAFKNFDLNIFFQWSYGNKILNANRIFLEGNEVGSPYVNQFASYEDRWTPDNPSNTLYSSTGRGPLAYSSRLLEDGSFLRLKTLALGYRIPDRLVRSVKMKNLRVYVSGQNLLTWTNYSGLDPEVSVRNSPLSPGFDYSAYPRSRVFTFGLSASL